MLKYATFTSDIDLPFYTSLASHKINHDKLDDSARRILGLYEIRPNDTPETSCRMQIHGNALTSDTIPAGYYRAEGLIKNLNTIEEYRNLDKTSILTQAARTVWEAIVDGTIYSCPSLLSAFSVICFADLKKYKFTYLFAFPALHANPTWTFDSSGTEGSNEWHIQDPLGIVRLTGAESSALVDAVQTWRYTVDPRQHGFFLVKKRSSHVDSGRDIERSEQESPNLANKGTKELDFTWNIASLGKFERGFFHDVKERDQYVAFADPSTYAEYPGWMLRNLLIIVSRRWKLQKVQILCYRDVQARRDDAKSIIMPIRSSPPSSTLSDVESSTMPTTSGWERNSNGKVVSRIANLGDFMDPKRHVKSKQMTFRVGSDLCYSLADQAVDLNLKLIKWRIAPDLNLDVIKRSKCLLIGAGTLGSYVARNLMGWGVRHITFVDNGRVSFSNPVRQPLYNHEDCMHGGASKALRAAESLKEIYPGVNSAGVVMSVPMAGHAILDEPSTEADFNSLKALIKNHDAIFLLMDTRESRWLPSVMGKAHSKIVLNAALGFDSYLVMRHGAKSEPSEAQGLGCYFCNDVVAPIDSMSDRTLDQQCTVTRPGVAAIASALLVEIFVSVLQHPQLNRAPAPERQSDDRGEHPLGIIPHQIRGFLPNFQNLVIRGTSYDRCSACSERITSAYDTDGWAFVRRALNEKGFVEELSGLAEVQRAAEKALADVDFAEDDGGTDGEAELL